MRVSAFSECTEIIGVALNIDIKVSARTSIL